MSKAANTSPATVGVVGIGMMGWPMAACLVKAGHAVSVCDARAARMADFVAQVGGTAVQDPADLGAGCDIVITMLPDSKAVAAALFDAGGLASRMRPGTMVIDMTSGVPTQTIEIGERLAAMNIGIIDAPVSGGVARARTGELAIMVGGDEALIARARPVLDAMGASLVTGGLGSGQAMKALNNLVSAGGFLIGVEALLIGKRFGLDPDTMVDVLNASTGMNNSTQKKFKQFVNSGSYESGFALDLMVKDLSIALDVGRDGKVPTPFAALCREMWASAQALLGPGADHTACARLSETLAGQSLVRSSKQE